MDVITAIATILFVAMMIMVILALSNKWLPIQACKYMGWHLAPKEQGFDGCSFKGQCPRCGKYVMQDGQGNWF